MARKRTSSTTLAAPSREASFIFRGTVLKAKASAVADVKPAARTSIVRVDDVISAPPALARAVGREITVILEEGSSVVREGTQAVFRASGASFGEEIAVRATVDDSAVPMTRGIGAARAAAAPLAASGVADPVQTHRDLLLKRGLDKADVVVAGTVTQVRMAPDVAGPAIAAGGAPGRRRGMAAGPAGRADVPQRISEHDPIWHEAVVTVDSVEKGQTRQKQVVVRFPGSDDVRWRYHPKLQVGQQGVFLLNEGRQAPAGARRGVRGAAVGLTAMAVAGGQDSALEATAEPHPISDIERVRQLLEMPRVTAAGGAATPPARRGGRRSPKAAKKARATARRRR